MALGVSVLMDIDHLYDFYQWYIKGRSNRIHILLHGWEYSAAGAIMLAVVFFHPLVLAAVLAHFVHVTTDHLHNRLSTFGYSISYRVIKRFDAAVIAPGYDVMLAYQSWPQLVPFGRRLMPWFQRRIEPWFEARVKEAASYRPSSQPSDD